MSCVETDEQAAIRSMVGQWARDLDSRTVVRRMEADPTAWVQSWPVLIGLGVLGQGIADDEVIGLPELGAVMEAAGEELVAGPLLSTAVAVRVLTDALNAPEDLGAARADLSGLLQCLQSGEVTAGLVLEAGAGEAAHALGATRGSAVLVVTDSGCRLILPGAVEIEPVEAFDLSQPVGRVNVRDAESLLLDVDSQAVRDLALVLAAAGLSGSAAWCARTASSYAGLRQQFGQPIARFQAVKHLCAEIHCAGERISALAWSGLRSLGGDSDRSALTAAAAGGLALEDAVRAAQMTVQVLGGIGYSFEHDAHLYLRRALALRQFFGGSDLSRTRAEALARGGARQIGLPAVRMSEPHNRTAVFEADIAVVAGAAPAARQSALADLGLVMPDLAPPFGRGADLGEQLFIDAELARQGVRRDQLNITNWAVPTLLDHGSKELVECLVLPSLRNELLWCQLFSEPGAGSDLAGVTTRATRVDGGWLVTGQKVWNSFARDADWGLLLARTDRDSKRHAGLTMFVLPMRSPGVRCVPLREITGEALFNEVFLDEVFIADKHVVGTPGDGWMVARTTLASERIAMGGAGAFGPEEEAMLRVTAATTVPRETVGAHVAEAVALAAMGHLRIARLLSGRANGGEPMVAKVLGVRHRQMMAETSLAAIGQAGLAISDEGTHTLMVRCLSIAGGSEQVLLNAIGERVLGLPR